MFLIYLIMAGVSIVPYLLLLAMMSSAEQAGGPAQTMVFLMFFGFMAFIYLMVIPFYSVLGTVSYAEMTYQ